MRADVFASCIVVMCALSGGILESSASAQGAQSELRDSREAHLADIRQLTFGGENAEAYWSPDGQSLIFQSARPPFECDQIFRMAADGSGEPELLSTGKGRTTCAYFTYPEAERILYASTHAADPACPPNPDRSQGYVWPIYSTYEIYSALPDGSDLKALTDNDAYDAEATLCPRDGTILFTSMRDGDLDLYRMNPDGSDVVRLTDTPGYDGGAFFSADCSKIVWRASRPQPGEELEAYQSLLAQGLVKPSKMEIWVAYADGSEARQLTYFESGSFAPFFTPDGGRILFSSNFGSGSPREFDIWAINIDGTELERITYAEGFDGFPMFSPDGTRLAFASNRNQGKPGETDVYVARWVEEPTGEHPGPFPYSAAADRYLEDVAWLAEDAREGRGIGTEGLQAATRWLEERFAALGVEPAGTPPTGTNGDGPGSSRHTFPVPVEVVIGADTWVAINGVELEREGEEATYVPAAFSASAAAQGAVVAAGYGITAEDLEWDDYAGLDVQGKIVAVRRFTPTEGKFEDETAQRRYSDLRYKAFNARQHGATALLVVDLPPGEEGAEAEEAPLPKLRVDAKGDAGIPVVFLKRSVGGPLFDQGGAVEVAVDLAVRYDPNANANVVGRFPAGAPPEQRLPGAVLVGAHYDHLGYGGPNSLAPDRHEPHNGADDNASGTAGLLEVARWLGEHREELKRDVYLVAFSAEESGLLGSSALVKEPPPGLVIDDLVAMLNMDMIGRLRGNKVSVLGAESAEEWHRMVEPLCDGLGLECGLGGDGYGPSDQTPFYAAGVPVLHFFTGAHEDYHKPSDDTVGVNAVGGARIAQLVAATALAVSAVEDLTYQEVVAPAPQGDRRSYGAYLGTIPDYADDGQGGVLLSGTRKGSPAEKAGFQRGDRLVELKGTEIGDIYDFVFVLRGARPGEETSAVVLRDGERVELRVTFGSRAEKGE
jgi:Tol biopolymer transport system component